LRSLAQGRQKGIVEELKRILVFLSLLSITLVFYFAYLQEKKIDETCNNSIFKNEIDVVRQYFELAIKDSAYIWNEERASLNNNSSYKIVEPQIKENQLLMFENFDEFYNENTANIDVFFYSKPKKVENTSHYVRNMGKIMISYFPRFITENGEIAVLYDRKTVPSYNYTCNEYYFDSCGKFRSLCGGDFLHSR